MIIRWIKLKNFRQFKGEHIIEFPFQENKNVVVICGLNTAGKTTLVQAFLWVLYGKADFKTKDLLLNLEVADSMMPGQREEMSVSLALVDKGIEYTITKTQYYICKSNGNIVPEDAISTLYYKEPNGNMKLISTKQHVIDDYINRILPEELSRYFFFDGERIGNLSRKDKAGRQELSSAVKSILGLAEFSNAIEHLSNGNKSVLALFRNSLDTESQDRAEAIKKEIDELEIEKENKQKIKADIEKDIKKYEEKINEIEEILRQNEDTANLQKQIDENNKKIKILEDYKEEKKKRLRDKISGSAFFYFCKPLIEKIEKSLKEFSSSIDVVPKIQADTIDYIIERGICICGNKVERGSETYNNLVELKKFLPPYYLGTAINDFLNESNSYKSEAEEFLPEINNMYEDYRRIVQQINELLDENDMIDKKIGEKKNMESYRDAKELYLKQKQKKERELIDIVARLQNIDKQINDRNRELERLAEKNEKNKFIFLCIEYTKKIIEELQEHYNRKEKEIREKLNEKVNQIFSQMYHGEKRNIVIDDEYNYEIITESVSSELNDKADESRGLETVASFAFIGGIIALAKEKIASKSANKIENEEELVIELESEPYPLVMDAPFSNLDETHVRNVSKILPEIAEQVIMFIMAKDWNYAKDVLSNKVAALYELKKISETHTKIEKVLY
ncbi:MAG: AAA family ATPase [Thermosediminibacteraceae bacterium]|nr:AAA family ATPase [Thermosediminibacteraceae bacterium]